MKLNKVFLEGNLTADAEIRMTSVGTKLQTFIVAVNDDYKPKDSKEWIKRTYYVPCYCAGKQYDGLYKGTKVAIDGKLIIKPYVKDGINRTFTNVEVYQLSLVKSKSESEKTQKKATEEYTKERQVEEDEEVPF